TAVTRDRGRDRIARCPTGRYAGAPAAARGCAAIPPAARHAARSADRRPPCRNRHGRRRRAADGEGVRATTSSDRQTWRIPPLVLKPARESASVRISRLADCHRFGGGEVPL